MVAAPELAILPKEIVEEPMEESCCETEKQKSTFEHEKYLEHIEKQNNTLLVGVGNDERLTFDRGNDVVETTDVD